MSVENQDEYLFEFYGYGQKLGEVVTTGKTVGEAFAKARVLAQQDGYVTSIKHGRGIYNV